MLPRPQPEKEIGAEDAAALKKSLSRQGLSGNRIALAAPEQILLRTTMEVPAKVAGAPRSRLSGWNCPVCTISPRIRSSWRTGSWRRRIIRGRSSQTLAVGCPHEAANAFLDVFESAGFRVAALDVRSAAVTRACRPLLLPAPQITVMVDLGWRSTSVLFVCGPSLVYERSVPGAPMGDLTAKFTELFSLAPGAAYQIVGTVGPGPEEPTGQYDAESLEVIRKHMRAHFDKLLDELRVPLSYANHQFPGEGVKRLLLIGGGAGVPGLASYFEARLGLEVKRAAPSDLMDTPPELSAKAANPALTCAVGLAQFEGV